MMFLFSHNFKGRHQILLMCADDEEEEGVFKRGRESEKKGLNQKKETLNLYGGKKFAKKRKKKVSFSLFVTHTGVVGCPPLLLLFFFSFSSNALFIVAHKSERQKPKRRRGRGRDERERERERERSFPSKRERKKKKKKKN